MINKNIPNRQSHLEYYRQHNIAPVRYDLRNLDSHFDRRQSLYNKLSLTPLALRGSRILEVAAGTGHNSLYLASQNPLSLTLLEPNAVALDHIRQTYSQYGHNYLTPAIIETKLEEYFPEKKFDIVLCENWLGTSEDELELLVKLTSFLEKNGILIITTVSPIGFVPNLLRRYLSNCVADCFLSFSERTLIIEKSFSSHLQNLQGMTRTITDWIHDNMLNPAYFGLCLSPPTVLTKLGECFDVLAVYPDLIEDWRWFKQLHGDKKQNNAHFIRQYWIKCHNFLDFQMLPFAGDEELNKDLEEYAHLIMKSVERHEDAILSGGQVAYPKEELVKNLEKFIINLPQHCGRARVGLQEALNMIQKNEKITPEMLSRMSEFSELFGRETSYMALIKR